MTTPRVCEALTAILRSRVKWDEAPAVYVMYKRNDGGVGLSAILPEGVWPSGPPGQVLDSYAERFRGTDPALLAMITPGNLLGMAFRSEMWGLTGGPAARALASGVRPSKHPERVEQRVVWAVTLDGTHYTAIQNRGEKAVLAHKVTEPHGYIPEALEKMCRAVTAGVN